MRTAKFVQIYASSFLLKEIKLEAGGLEGEGISISHLNSAFLCGIVTLYERRGIYGGFCHQRKIKSLKSWDAFFSLVSITYMCRYLKTVTCTFLVRILKPLGTCFKTFSEFSEVDHDCGLSLWSLEHHHHKLQPHQGSYREQGHRHHRCHYEKSWMSGGSPPGWLVCPMQVELGRAPWQIKPQKSPEGNLLRGDSGQVKKWERRNSNPSSHAETFQVCYFQ